MGDTSVSQALFITLDDALTSKEDRQALHQLANLVTIEFLDQVQLVVNDLSCSLNQPSQPLTFSSNLEAFRHSVATSVPQFDANELSPNPLDVIQTIQTEIEKYGQGYTYHFWIFSDLSYQRILDILKPLFPYKALFLIIQPTNVSLPTSSPTIHFYNGEPDLGSQSQSGEASYYHLISKIVDKFYRPYQASIRVGQLIQDVGISYVPNHISQIDVVDIIGFSPLSLCYNVVFTSQHQLTSYQTNSLTCLLKVLKSTLQSESLFAIARVGSNNLMGLVHYSLSGGLTLGVLHSDFPLPGPWNRDCHVSLKSGPTPLTSRSLWRSSNHLRHIWAHHPYKLFRRLYRYINNPTEQLPLLTSTIKALNQAHDIYSLQKVMTAALFFLDQEISSYPSDSLDHKKLHLVRNLLQLDSSLESSSKIQLPDRPSLLKSPTDVSSWVHAYKFRDRAALVIQFKSNQETESDSFTVPSTPLLPPSGPDIACQNSADDNIENAVSQSESSHNNNLLSASTLLEKMSNENSPTHKLSKTDIIKSEGTTTNGRSNIMLVPKVTDHKVASAPETVQHTPSHRSPRSQSLVPTDTPNKHFLNTTQAPSGTDVTLSNSLSPGTETAAPNSHLDTEEVEPEHPVVFSKSNDNQPEVPIVSSKPGDVELEVPIISIKPNDAEPEAPEVSSNTEKTEPRDTIASSKPGNTEPEVPILSSSPEKIEPNVPIAPKPEGTEPEAHIEVSNTDIVEPKAPTTLAKLDEEELKPPVVSSSTENGEPEISIVTSNNVNVETNDHVVSPGAGNVESNVTIPSSNISNDELPPPTVTSNTDKIKPEALINNSSTESSQTSKPSISVTVPTASDNNPSIIAQASNSNSALKSESNSDSDVPLSTRRSKLKKPLSRVVSENNPPASKRKTRRSLPLDSSSEDDQTSSDQSDMARSPPSRRKLRQVKSPTEPSKTMTRTTSATAKKTSSVTTRSSGSNRPLASSQVNSLGNQPTSSVKKKPGRKPASASNQALKPNSGLNNKRGYVSVSPESSTSSSYSDLAEVDISDSSTTTSEEVIMTRSKRLIKPNPTIVEPKSAKSKEPITKKAAKTRASRGTKRKPKIEPEDSSKDLIDSKNIMSPVGKEMNPSRIIAPSPAHIKQETDSQKVKMEPGSNFILEQNQSLESATNSGVGKKLDVETLGENLHQNDSIPIKSDKLSKHKSQRQILPKKSETATKAECNDDQRDSPSLMEIYLATKTKGKSKSTQNSLAESKKPVIPTVSENLSSKLPIPQENKEMESEVQTLIDTTKSESLALPIDQESVDSLPADSNTQLDLNESKTKPGKAKKVTKPKSATEKEDKTPAKRKAVVKTKEKKADLPEDLENPPAKRKYSRKNKQKSPLPSEHVSGLNAVGPPLALSGSNRESPVPSSEPGSAQPLLPASSSNDQNAQFSLTELTKMRFNSLFSRQPKKQTSGSATKNPSVTNLEPGSTNQNIDGSSEVPPPMVPGTINHLPQEPLDNPAIFMAPNKTEPPVVVTPITSHPSTQPVSLPNNRQKRMYNYVPIEERINPQPSSIGFEQTSGGATEVKIQDNLPISIAPQNPPSLPVELAPKVHPIVHTPLLAKPENPPDSFLNTILANPPIAPAPVAPPAATKKANTRKKATKRAIVPEETLEDTSQEAMVAAKAKPKKPRMTKKALALASAEAQAAKNIEASADLQPPMRDRPVVPPLTLPKESHSINTGASLQNIMQHSSILSKDKKAESFYPLVPPSQSTRILNPPGNHVYPEVPIPQSYVPNPPWDTATVSKQMAPRESPYSNSVILDSTVPRGSNKQPGNSFEPRPSILNEDTLTDKFSVLPHSSKSNLDQEQTRHFVHPSLASQNPKSYHPQESRGSQLETNTKVLRHTTLSKPSSSHHHPVLPGTSVYHHNYSGTDSQPRDSKPVPDSTPFNLSVNPNISSHNSILTNASKPHSNPASNVFFDPQSTSQAHMGSRSGLYNNQYPAPVPHEAVNSQMGSTKAPGHTFSDHSIRSIIDQTDSQPYARKSASKYREKRGSTSHSIINSNILQSNPMETNESPMRPPNAMANSLNPLPTEEEREETTRKSSLRHLLN